MTEMDVVHVCLEGSRVLKSRSAIAMVTDEELLLFLLRVPQPTAELVSVQVILRLSAVVITYVATEHE